MSEHETEPTAEGVDVFVHLPLPMYRRLRLAAEAERSTLAQVVRAAVEQYLCAPKGGGA